VEITENLLDVLGNLEILFCLRCLSIVMVNKNDKKNHLGQEDIQQNQVNTFELHLCRIDTGYILNNQSKMAAN
jgi:hypothetical protein